MNIYPDYILLLYYWLHTLSDAELDAFFVNDHRCRSSLFRAVRAEFDQFGPTSRQRVLDAIVYIFFTGGVDRHWRDVVPHDVPLDEVEDKNEYVQQLYEALSDRPLMLSRNFDPDVNLIYGREKIDSRL